MDVSRKTDDGQRTEEEAAALPSPVPRRPSSDLADGLPLPQRYWAILTIGFAITMTVLDSAIANVALPTIAKDLHASAASSIWVVNAYQLAITILLLPFASLGEIVGYRRLYWAGLAGFTVASLGCALADSLLTLTIARVVQGVGAAAVLSINGALVRFTYPRAMLGRGIGINAVVVACSAALGPTVAAAILAVAPWPWLFAVNVPVGLVALVAARALPRVPGTRRRFDIASAFLNAVFFGLLIAAIDGAGHGEAAFLVALETLTALFAGALLVLRQLPQTAPLLPVDLLRIPLFALSIATSVTSFVGQMLAYTLLPFYLQDALGRSQVETGLLMTPWPLATAIVAPFSGRLADRYHPGLLGGIGLAIFALGLGALALMPTVPSVLDIGWRMAICGVGFGIFQSPNNRAIIDSAPRERSGGASGMLGTARLLGQTMGTALAALMLGIVAEQATTVGLALASGFALIAATVSALRLFGTKQA